MKAVDFSLSDRSESKDKSFEAIFDPFFQLQRQRHWAFGASVAGFVAHAALRGKRPESGKG